MNTTSCCSFLQKTLSDGCEICNPRGTRLKKEALEKIAQLEHQRDELLALLKAVQSGQEFTPEFCARLDETIARIEA